MRSITSRPPSKKLAVVEEFEDESWQDWIRRQTNPSKIAKPAQTSERKTTTVSAAMSDAIASAVQRSSARNVSDEKDETAGTAMPTVSKLQKGTIA